MEAKEEVRAKLNIEDVIGEYVSLKRAGRNFKGLSPFTNEKTPSFIVSPEKQIWHCFSTNKGGDVFSFVMEVEGLDFRGALELLARKAGVDLSLFQTSGSKDLAQKKHRLLSALDLSANYYQQSLLKNPKALEYVFKKRGLNKEVVQSFRIGYSPQADDGLVRALIKRGFKEQELKDAGLAVMRRGRLSDMFRGRMMVPLCDGQGQVVGFTARLIPPEGGQASDVKDAPKYINTSQTLLYDKGRQVFGFHLAKEAIRANDQVVIVEGNLDVVSSHQADVKQVVAAAGTALTEYHLKSVKRLTHNVALAFDADTAGLAATERAIGLAQLLSIRLTVVVLPPDVKDPDELIQKDAEAWQVAIKNSVPVVDWIIDQYTARYDVATAEGKREVTTRALQVISHLQDAVEREHYLNLLSERTGASVSALIEKLHSSAGDPNQQQRPFDKLRARQKTVSLAPAGPDTFAYEDTLLALAITDSATRDVLHAIEPSDLHSEPRGRILAFLKANPGAKIGDTLPKGLQSDETYVKVLLLIAETANDQRDSNDRYFIASELVSRVTKAKTKGKKAALTAELREAEAAGDRERAVRLKNELNALIKDQANA